MHRRDLSKALFVTAAGAVVPRAEAQTCTAPCYAQTAAEATASVTPTSTWATPDGIDTLNVFRFMTAAQIADVLAGTQTLDVSAAIQAANDYLEGSATAQTGRKTASTPGGTLYFPGGRYYCGTTGLRVGDMVTINRVERHARERPYRTAHSDQSP